MPRHSPPSPVTARVRALLGIDVEGRRRAVDVAARVARADEQGPWGWIPDPPVPVSGEPDDPDEPDVSTPLGPERGMGRRGRHRPPAGPALVTTPMSLRRARVHVSWQAVVALVVVVLAAVLVFAVRVARAEQSSQPQPVSRSTPSGVVGRTVPPAFASTGPSGGVGTAAAGGAGAARSSSAPGGGAGAGGAPPATMIMVHVVGQVARPGVVRLALGARVADAVTLAGGASPGADLQHVNLARALLDGEQVYVPRPGETVPPTPGPAAGASTGAGTGAAGAGTRAAGQPGGGSSGVVVNLNTADASALDGLPGLGPVLAQRIIDWRTEHGRFTSIEELAEVSGIGEKLLSQIRARVTV